MRSVDIIIVGGGMVGLAFAGLLADTTCKIILIERQPFNPDLSQYSNRVSAINYHSKQLLLEIGAWQKIPLNKISAYQQILVKEKDSFAQLTFNNDDPTVRALALDELGAIVENQWIQQSLWQQINQQSNVEVIIAPIARCGIGEQGAVLTLNNGEILTTKLLIGADGANSWVRQQAHIPLISRDYQHTALVCNIETVEPHNQIARQIFSADSILAFLPLPDPHLCSIVWSLPPEQAEKLATIDEISFNQTICTAFDNQLGLCKVNSLRKIYPLTARYARNFAQPYIALIGDAAHTIHPLAGLGVNLGFADAKCLAEQIKYHLKSGHHIGHYRHLRTFERQRKLEAVKTLATMEALKQTFSGDFPIKKLLRGLGVHAIDHFPLLKKYLIAQAVGKIS